MYCSSQWAIEGYCDVRFAHPTSRKILTRVKSLAYEIAPFNVKMSIVQANMEVNVLTNRMTSVPPLLEYSQAENPAPLAREIFSGLLDKLDRVNNPLAFGDDKSPSDSTSTTSPDGIIHEPSTGDLLSSDTVTSLYPPLPQA